MPLQILVHHGHNADGKIACNTAANLEEANTFSAAVAFIIFCQVSDSTTSYGSYSGAHPNEKITWGKLDIHTPKFIIESDATIVAPLVFAWVLGW